MNPRSLDHLPLESLSEQERSWLVDSDAFCIIPWVHLHGHPDGRAFPCCLADLNLPIGDLRTQSIEELWNSPVQKELRTKMLRGEQPAACRKCYERESAGFTSKRNGSNQQLGHHVSVVHDTLADGSTPRPHLVYLDIRFSNVCNLGCRSCSPLFSSRLYGDYSALAGEPPPHPKVMHAGGDPEAMWARLEPHLDALEKITFGGGEPLLMEEHWRLLRTLDERGLHRVRLYYHTNMTGYEYKGQDALELWSRFEEVHVGGSLDAMGPRAELMRHGTDWPQIEVNRRRMQELCPSVHFIVGPTLGLTNSLHLPDFHKDWVERGLIEPDQFSVSVLQEPEWQRIDALPPALKRQVEVRYAEHLEWLADRGAAEETLESYRSVLRFMNAADRSSELRRFVGYTRRLDELRHQDTFAVFPELRPILDALAP